MQNTLAQLPEEEQPRIDRYKLVTRHNIVLNEADALSPVTVGNGDFAYTADITGMQSLEDYYYKNGIPLETLSTWAWHSFPNTGNLKIEGSTRVSNFLGRKIAYASLEKSVAGDYFRKNPHPVALGQVSLVTRDGKPLQLDMIKDITQKLDLWTGLLTSHYTVNNSPVTVETVSHPELSLVAFKIRSPLLKSGDLQASAAVI